MNLENKTRQKVLMLVLPDLRFWEVINHLLPMSHL
jgi:hypothetical protein